MCFICLQSYHWDGVFAVFTAGAYPRTNNDLSALSQPLERASEPEGAPPRGPGACIYRLEGGNPAVYLRKEARFPILKIPNNSHSFNHNYLYFIQNLFYSVY